MDFCLKFKSQAHAEAFKSNFSLQLKKRFRLGLLIFGMRYLSTILDYSMNFTMKNPSVIAWSFVRIVVSLLWLFGVFWVERRCNRFIKRAGRILLFLDVLALISTADMLALSADQTNAFQGLQMAILGWYMGVSFVCSIFLIGLWELRIASCLIQVIMYISIVCMNIELPKIMIYYLIQVFLIYAISSYIRERYWRIESLQKIKLYQETESIKKVLDDVLEGIVVIDAKKKILYLNESAEKMFQRKISSLEDLFSDFKIKAMAPPSSKRNDLLKEEDETLNDVFEEIRSRLLIQESRSSQQTPFVTVECSKKDENDSWRHYTLKFALSIYNEKKVIVANINDTTEREALRTLQDDNNYKTRLFASVSHELRTPLNGSINFTEQALNDPDIPQSAKNNFILPALRSNRMLLSLINDFLDFSQMQANKLRLVFEPKNIIETAKECIELLEIQASKRGIGLKLESLISPNREIILSDHNRLKQIILNFLSNAVKFTFEGSVVLSLEEIAISEYHGIRIKCSDTGIGIDEENQAKLFKAFEKIELGSNSKINATGVGLGLVISNNLAELLNQGAPASDNRSIQFVSIPSKGSNFWVDIIDREMLENRPLHSLNSDRFSEKDLTEKHHDETELRCDHNLSTKRKRSLDRVKTPDSSLTSIPLKLRRGGTYRSQELTTAPQSQVKCSCPSILIVDDDSFNLTALDQHLLKLKMACEWAFNGLQAIEKIKRRQSHPCSVCCEQYKVVFLDCNMPVMDGFQTSRMLRQMIAQKEISPLKIIACTAFVQASELDQAIAAGMDDYCIKPISHMIIKQKLAKFGI